MIVNNFDRSESDSRPSTMSADSSSPGSSSASPAAAGSGTTPSACRTRAIVNSWRTSERFATLVVTTNASAPAAASHGASSTTTKSWSGSGVRSRRTRALSNQLALSVAIRTAGR